MWYSYEKKVGTYKIGYAEVEKWYKMEGKIIKYCLLIRQKAKSL